MPIMSPPMHTSDRPRIAYTVHGRSGAPVLFIMGLGMRGAVWAPQLEVLRGHFRCCAYDHVGVGASESSADWPGVASMADDAVRVLDALGWKSAHVVGVSLGGMIAQELALRHPSRCRSLALIATHPGGRFAAVPTARGLRHLANVVLGRSRGRALARLLHPPSYLARIDPGTLRQAIGARLGSRPPLATLLRQLQAAARHDTVARLPELTLPTLLVRPGQDILIRPAQTDRLARGIRHARVLRYDDAGHGVIFSKRHELNPALRAHIDAAEAARGAHGA